MSSTVSASISVVERQIPVGGVELAGPRPVELGDVGRRRAGEQGRHQLRADVVPGQGLQVDMDAGLLLEVGGDGRLPAATASAR